MSCLKTFACHAALYIHTWCLRFVLVSLTSVCLSLVNFLFSLLQPPRSLLGLVCGRRQPFVHHVQLSVNRQGIVAYMRTAVHFLARCARRVFVVSSFVSMTYCPCLCADMLRCMVVCSATLCSVALRCVAFCLCCVVLCCVVLCCVVLCCVVLCCVVLCCVVLCCVVLCCVVLCCVVVCCLALRRYVVLNSSP